MNIHIPKKSLELPLEDPLPQEDDLGNVEYKIHIVNIDNKRFHKLVTQMSWRMNEGTGICYYHIGIPDDGKPRGITRKYMLESLENLFKVCKYLKFNYELVYFKRGISGGFCAKICIINNNSSASYS